MYSCIVIISIIVVAVYLKDILPIRTFPIIKGHSTLRLAESPINLKCGQIFNPEDNRAFSGCPSHIPLQRNDKGSLRLDYTIFQHPDTHPYWLYRRVVKGNDSLTCRGIIEINLVCDIFPLFVQYRIFRIEGICFHFHLVNAAHTQLGTDSTNRAHLIYGKRTRNILLYYPLRAEYLKGGIPSLCPPPGKVKRIIEEFREKERKICVLNVVFWAFSVKAHIKWLHESRSA